MGRALGVAVVPGEELTSGNLYVRVDGQEKRVADLHPDDAAYERREPQLALRQHPGAYFRLRVGPEDVWRPPADADAHKSLELFLAPRLSQPSWPGTPAPSAQRLTTWNWVALVGSALNALGLCFFPLADSSTLAQLHALGGKPTALTRLVSGGWFSPLLAILTAACLLQVYRNPTRRKLWINLSYVPVLIGFLATVVGLYSAYASVLDSIR